jgi:lysylphosphatidylglycerol synthetase-like protein (DUF2156 family)
MGWPLAVSAGLMERSSRALVAALGPLTVGHLLAMLVVILPFSLLVALVQWQRQIQIGASLLVIGFGSFRLINRSHLGIFVIPVGAYFLDGTKQYANNTEPFAFAWGACYAVSLLILVRSLITLMRDANYERRTGFYRFRRR